MSAKLHRTVRTIDRLLIDRYLAVWAGLSPRLAEIRRQGSVAVFEVWQSSIEHYHGPDTESEIRMIFNDGQSETVTIRLSNEQ